MDKLKKGILIMLIGIAIVGVITSFVSGHGQDSSTEPAKESINDKATYKHFAGLKLKEIVTEDTYMLTDGKTTMLYINETAMEENLDENLSNKITKKDALEISKKICGDGYVLDHIVENPFDFDILYKRYIGGIEVFGGNCYVVINSKTGKVATYRKLVFDIPKLSEPKISKEEIKNKSGNDVNLVVIPHLNKLVWATKDRLMKMFDANTGKEIGKIEIKKIKEAMKTDEGIGNLKKKSTDIRYSTKSINNNQGAVFEDGSSSPEHTDDIQKAKDSMETKRPNNQPAWDSYINNYGIKPTIECINYIFKNYEGVYASTHGNGDCLEDKNGDWEYCTEDMVSGLQTRLFVTPACYAGNNFATQLHYHGVECVIASSGETKESGLWDECGNWADSFWDKATGNKDAGYQRSAHVARMEANSDTWLDWCDLDTEKGSCGIFI